MSGWKPRKGMGRKDARKRRINRVLPDDWHTWRVPGLSAVYISPRIPFDLHQELLGAFLYGLDAEKAAHPDRLRHKFELVDHNGTSYGATVLLDRKRDAFIMTLAEWRAFDP